MKDELRSVVADLIERAEYDEQVREYLALRSKLALLEAEMSADALAADDAYTQYRDRIETLEQDTENGSEEAETAIEQMRPTDTQ
jgi:hypothetical protein